MNENDAAEPAISGDQRYRLLTEAVLNCAFITLNGENRITDWSDGAEHLFGYTRAEVLNQSVRILHTAEDCESGEIERDVEAALRDGRSDDERWHLRKNGSRFWGIAHRVAARGGRGELLGYITVVCDLTVRVQAEQEAERWEKLHTFLLMLADRLQEAESAEAVVRAGAEVIGRYIRASAVLYGEVNADDGPVKIRTIWADQHARPQETSDAAELVNRIGEAWHANELWVVRDVETDARSFVRRMLPTYRVRGIRAMIGIPIRRNDGWHAVLVVESAHPRPWTPTEIELMGQAADRMISALGHGRLVEKLRRSEFLLHRLLEIETVGILFFRPTGEIIRANQAFLRMTGHTQRDVEAGRLNMGGLNPPEWKPTLRSDLEQLKATGNTAPFEMEFRRIDDSRGWALCAARKLDEGEMVAFLLDISERKKIEQDLRSNQQQLELLANNVPELLWSTDATGMRSWCNSRWTEYTGQSLDETHSLGWLNVIHPEDREQSKEAFLNSLRSGEPWRHEHRLRRKDGEYRWFLVHVIPIRNASNQVTHWFGSVTDIHEQRLAMDARGRDLEINQRDLQQTTAKLMQVQEDVARELARDLHDSVSQQLAVMGMDLAQVRAQLAESAPALTRSIAEVERQASALAEEVRLLSHRLHPSVLEDLGLAPALETLIRDFKRVHGIKIVLDVTGLTNQPSQLISMTVYRIAQEALQNVAKHAAAATVAVTVFESSGAIHLFVEDNGPGFDRARIQPGLGLISMQERSHLVGGELHVDSSIGRGTAVHFVAPLA